MYVNPVLGFIVLLLNIFWAENSRDKALLENGEGNRGENREASACDALLRALHAPGGADEERIARGCPASLCTTP